MERDIERDIERDRERERYRYVDGEGEREMFIFKY